jgi:hypothetical protein
MKRRIKIEWFKAKLAFMLMLFFVACADTGVSFVVLSLASLLWLFVCAKRLERMGELDD